MGRLSFGVVLSSHRAAEAVLLGQTVDLRHLRVIT